MTVLLQARRIQTRSSSYRCNCRIINHLALKYGQNGIFEKQDHYPLYKTHIRKEHYQSLRNENGQKVIFRSIDHEAMRIQIDSSSYRCNCRIMVHLALNNGQNVIFESKTCTPHIRLIIVHLEMKNGQKVIFEKQEQNPP